MNHEQKKYGKIIALVIGGLSFVYALAVYFFLIHKTHKTDNTSNQSATPLLIQDAICRQTDSSLCRDIQIAISPQERALGLMNRKSIPTSYGMLFVFATEDKHGFWMKNTLIPLDILWLDTDFTIVSTASMVPCTTDICQVYTPTDNAKYALEIKKGQIDTYNITNGEQLLFSETLLEAIVE